VFAQNVRCPRPPGLPRIRVAGPQIGLSALPQASEPLTTRDIALQLLVERALDKSDQRVLRLVTSGSRSGANGKTALSGAIRGRGNTCFGRLTEALEWPRQSVAPFFDSATY
jgi:hypothetical protein